MDYLKEDKWERQVTTRRYLHPPFAEELATMWIQLSHFIGDIYEKDAIKIVDFNYAGKSTSTYVKTKSQIFRMQATNKEDC